MALSFYLEPYLVGQDYFIVIATCISGTGGLLGGTYIFIVEGKQSVKWLRKNKKRDEDELQSLRKTYYGNKSHER